MKSIINKIAIVILLGTCLAFTSPIKEPMVVFKAIKMVSYNDTTVISKVFNSIAFLLEPTDIPDVTPCIKIKDGNLILNSLPLKYNPYLRMYTDSLLRGDISEIKWQLIGSTNYINNTYTVTKPIPTFTKINLLPKTISKSQPLIINLGTLTGVDKVEFTINNQQILANMPFYKKMDANKGPIIISKENLAYLDPTKDSEIRIAFIAEEQREINGKIYLFENRLEILKAVKLTN